MVNAWIYLDEDEPAGTGYGSLNSSYQSLVNNKVYQSVDMLFVCFFDTIPDGKGYYTLEIGNAGTIHPGGLTTKQYLQNVIADSRKQNQAIKILATLNYNNDTLSRIFSGDQSKWEAEAAAFAANLSQYLVANLMNGFDVDWEGAFACSITQKQFAILFNAIFEAFKSNSEHLYLTLSPASVGNMDAPTVNKDFDFLNVQLYSGFTSCEEFLNAGVVPSKLAYGAQFEKGVGIWQNADSAYAGYSAGFNYAGIHYSYCAITQWRLNSDNYDYEQSQQVLLYQLVNGIQNAEFNDGAIISNAGNPPVTGLLVRSGNVVDSLQAANTATNGAIFNMLQHGGNGGTQSTIVLDQDDVITQVTGYKGSWFGWNCIVQITLKTKNGIIYGPFGDMSNVVSQTPFSFVAPSGKSIVAFNGSTVRVPEAGGGISYVLANLDVSYSN